MYVMNMELPWYLQELDILNIKKHSAHLVRECTMFLYLIRDYFAGTDVGCISLVRSLSVYEN